MRKFTASEMTQVGNYRITERIGSGSFGQVFLGYHKFLRVKVCLKRGSRDPSDIQTSDNTMREFYYLKQFDHHPHITKLYEVIFTDKYVYLALHYYPEGDLFNYLTKRGKIPTDESLKIFVQLVGAVYYMHRNGCCHRDLKLENVLLDHKLNIKLSDFGFSREIPLANANSNKGRRGKAFLTEICGTEAYMAPELVKRIPYSGIKIDIWALGVILYTILCGHMPFDDNLPSSKLRRFILDKDPDYGGGYFNPDVITLLKSMLAKAPEDRPGSLSDVLNLPFLKPYGAQNQLDVVSKLMDKDFGDLGAHNRITGSDKLLFKEMVRMGIDKECLRRSVEYNMLDSLDGFWKLLREKRRYNADKRKRRNRPVSYSRGVGILSGPKDLLGNIQKKKVNDRVKPKTIAEDVVPVKEVDEKRKDSSVLGPNAKLAVDEDVHQEESIISQGEDTSQLSSPKDDLLQRKQVSFSSPKKTNWFESIFSHLSHEKRKKNKISRSKTSESNNRESLVHRFFTSASAGRSTTTLNITTELEHRLSNSGGSEQTEDDKVAPLRSEIRPPPIIVPKIHGTHNSVAGSGHTSAFSSRATSPTGLVSRQTSIARSIRPSSVVSAYSIQTTLSETSNGSGYTTGYSTDNRPGITRGLSDMSVGSRDVSTSHPGSPSSSINGVSRATSIDSSSKPAPGQIRGKNNPGVAGGGPGRPHLGRKAALKAKINAKWNFGTPNTNGSLKRLRRGAPKQIIEEEEEEDDDSRRDVDAREDINDGLNCVTNQRRIANKLNPNLQHENISDNERVLTEDDSVIINRRLHGTDDLPQIPYKINHSKKNEYEDGNMADNEGDDNSNFDGAKYDGSSGGLSKVLTDSKQGESKISSFATGQIRAESTVIEDEDSVDNEDIVTNLKKFNVNQGSHEHLKKRT